MMWRYDPNARIVAHMTTLSVPGAIPGWTLADRLRKARAHAGMDQSQLAEMLEVSRGTVANYERATVPARPLMVKMWAMATGVDAEWLRTGEDPRQGEPDGGLESYAARESNPQPADQPNTLVRADFRRRSRALAA